MVLVFVGAGLLLTFTPCVLPMIPIVSAIVLGDSRYGHHHLRGFFLSLCYVTGMAMTYAIAGMLMARFGASFNLPALMQSPAVLLGSAILFVLLSLAMFGVFRMTLPHVLENRIQRTSHRLKGGRYGTAALMGVLSTLVVSPCISAPLAAALLYISSTGKMLTGFIALLSLGIGMGIPLLLVGSFGPKLLPKSGPWMEQIKNLFAVLLLAIAVALLSRLLNNSLWLWAIFLIVLAVCGGALERAKTLVQRLQKGVCIVGLCAGILLLIGAAMGSHDLLSPLKGLLQMQNSSIRDEGFKSTPSFTNIYSQKDLEQQVELAKDSGKPVLVDFYASWCTSCVEIDRHVLPDPQVSELLKHFTLLRADVTQNSPEQKALMQKYRLFGPPAFIFLTPDGQEYPHSAINGEISAPELVKRLRSLLSCHNSGKSSVASCIT
ncbi:protein-disulfide reductase DsbD [Dongshaea marina]|uniref:protein-disulfide reductase DsbD n=1 Tax=Dongshaea marina TaxID=2047966 RepID=UPI000D3E4B52|nr:protein-disulfide reductase DsbD [Dongshaea marina]